MAQRASGYDRLPHELYRTPRWVVDCVLPDLLAWGRRERAAPTSRPRETAIWEPAVGDGHVALPLREAGFEVFCSDLRATQLGRQQDFFKSNYVYPQVRGIVTNPPYDIAPEFVRHAVDMMRQRRGLVAMLLRVDWDSASTRVDLFRDCPAWGHKIVLLKRIVWDGLEKTNDPSTNHAWFVWDWRRRTGPPTTGYAP